MSAASFCVNEIGVRPTYVTGALRIELDMTKAQMKEALESFLSCITDDEWERWLRELAPDILATERAEGVQQGHADAMGVVGHG
jgi:hypothetical protein